jgi:hypothetical protein
VPVFSCFFVCLRRAFEKDFEDQGKLTFSNWSFFLFIRNRRIASLRVLIVSSVVSLLNLLFKCKRIVIQGCSRRRNGNAYDWEEGRSHTRVHR